MLCLNFLSDPVMICNLYLVLSSLIVRLLEKWHYKRTNVNTVCQEPWASTMLWTIIDTKCYRSPCHSFSESLNKIRLGQMDLYVRFWNASKKLSETWYLTSHFLGGGKADDILEKFEIGVSKRIHKASDLLQVASDGPNFDLLFL